MRAPARLIEIWAEGADGRGKSGSGWVVGDRGALTAAHVIPPTSTLIQVRRADTSSAGAWTDASIRWQHPTLDIALLEIAPNESQSWEPLPDESPRLAAIGSRVVDATAIGFPDANARPSGLRDTEEAPGRLLPGAGVRDTDRLIAFDVDGSVPETAQLWEGMSGAAVRDQHGRLMALVIRAHAAHQQRRLLLLALEEAVADGQFEAAAAAVGLDYTVEDHDAPVWLQSVDSRCLGRAGVPAPAGQVEDLCAFGVHATVAADVPDAAFPPYIGRDKDGELAKALSEAGRGGRRVVLIIGDSASGKSRSAAEAVRRDRILGTRPLVVPLVDQGLVRLINDDLPLDGAVVWLDDVDKHLGRGLYPEAIRGLLASNPRLIVVSTMRRSQLQSLQGRLSEPAWTFLTDEGLVNRVLEACMPPSDGSGFDAGRFLDERGVLFLIGTSGAQMSMAPVITSLIESIVDIAKQRAARLPHRRLTPPLGLFLDECANIAPLPSLPQLVSDGGGQGITTMVVLQSLGQARARWGTFGTSALWDACTAKVVLGGLADDRDLETIARLCGEVDVDVLGWNEARDGQRTSSSTRRRTQVMPPAKIRNLRKWRGLLLYEELRPIITSLPGWWMLRRCRERIRSSIRDYPTEARAS